MKTTPFFRSAAAVAATSKRHATDPASQPASQPSQASTPRSTTAYSVASRTFEVSTTPLENSLFEGKFGFVQPVCSSLRPASQPASQHLQEVSRVRHILQVHTVPRRYLPSTAEAASRNDTSGWVTSVSFRLLSISMTTSYLYTIGSDRPNEVRCDATRSHSGCL